MHVLTVLARTVPLLVVPVFGLMFAVLFVWVGVTRLQDARGAVAENRPALGHGIWAAIAVGVGMTLGYWCVRVLISVLALPPA